MYTDGARAATIRCDQAIFTSVRTPMGQGYRLVASSPGLSAAEKQTITRQSPSHGGLCCDDESATGVAFYPLPGGRLCASVSCTAGREQTGRGGPRIYTRLLAFDADEFARFAYNPFNIFRAMTALDLNKPILNPETTLPAMALPTDATPSTEATSRATELVGADWVTYILGLVQRGEHVIVAAEDDQSYVLETTLQALPGTARASVSIASGLQFSMARTFTLTSVTGDTSSIERIIRGHPSTLVHPRGDSRPPDGARTEWQTLVAHHWAAGTHRELIEFTSQDFQLWSPADLERLAALQNETRGAASASTADLLVRLGRWLACPGAHDLEERTRSDLLQTIRTRLERDWTTGDIAALAADWPELATLADHSEDALVFVAPLIGRALRRLADTAPDLGLELGLQLPTEPASRVVPRELQALREAAQRSLARADDQVARRLIDLLSRWDRAYPIARSGKTSQAGRTT
jgi:hypothetical protein